ncbi:hypothetical protein [Ensifer aridi]|uniref:hypothetical protein n=1 Tax=Ensifer aridi TaxID=1708715 RepID=UPI0004286BF9|nr:hypothetical protein [Ensifer aridi]
MKIVMGSPGIILGRSHSGNVSAMELAHLGLLDVLTSDYVPRSFAARGFRAGRRGFRPSEGGRDGDEEPCRPPRL